MSWSHYARITILSLLAVPIIYASVSFGSRSPTGIEVALTYFAVLYAGPLLLIYAFVMRYLIGEKRLSLVAFLIGGLWVSFEIIHTYMH